MWCIKATEIYCLTALAAGSLRSRCLQAWFLPRLQESVVCFAPGFWRLAGTLWCSLDASPSSALLLPLVSSLCICPKFPSVRGYQSQWVSRTPLGLHPNFTTFAVTLYPQIRSHSESRGLGL